MDVLRMNIPKIEEFIERVFGYYNGRINIVNPAELMVDYFERKSERSCDDHGLPNIVQLHAGFIWRTESSVNAFKSEVVYTLIHELYHVDQRVEFYRLIGKYGGDMQYRKYIEDSNDFMAVSYILGHLNEIHNLFGVVFNQNELEYYHDIYNSLITAPMYQRITYEDYIIQVIEGMFRMSDEVRVHIYSILNTENTVMYISINDNYFLLKNYRYRASMDMINAFFYNNMYQYDIFNLHARETMVEYDYCTKYVLEIDLDGNYNMCKCVE